MPHQETQPVLRLASSVPNQDDGILWAQFKSGDQEALATIYRLHIQALYNYGLKVCADTVLVEDSIQELFIYLWHSRENLGATNNIKYYLFKALRRKLVTGLENEARNNQKQGDFAAGQPETDLSPEMQLVAAEMHTDQQEQMQRALLTLTKRQREAIYLRFYDNLSFQEIADIMGLTVKSTYTLISRALEVLREYMQILIITFYLLLT